MRRIKKYFLPLFLLLMMSCSGETIRVKAVITKVEACPDCWACDSVSYIKTEQGFVDRIAYAYPVGDTIMGYWTEGKYEKEFNGFSTSN